jgi:prepilin-type N-terminal cleavage/methylation domain-containing protein
MPSANSQPKRPAFTLIEVLVVVAIIALLLAILMPSLARAREMTKITLCQANMKQIAIMTTEYQADFKEYVPILYNYYANGVPNHEAPARACLLSVGLRRYLPGSSQLKGKSGGKFDPEKVWTNLLRDEYENTILPAFFVCPFARGKGVGERWERTDAQFRYYVWEGRHEHYQSWLWRRMIRGEQPGNFWPGGPGTAKRGVLKYSNATWNMLPLTPTTAQVNSNEYRNIRHRKWTVADARSVKSASLSDLTALFCAQGEHMVHQNDSRVGRVNMRGHRKDVVGGTNVMFTDTHVEWVEGTRIGWP